jgi:sugar porter (SP) family MFS transporter
MSDLASADSARRASFGAMGRHQEAPGRISVWLPASVAAIGGLLFGFDTAVINGALVYLKRQFAMTDAATEAAASSLLLGCAVGAMLAGFLSDRLGRRKLLIVSAVLFAASAVGAAVPNNLQEFIIARLAGGLAIGVASMLSPLYIAEISPARIRGKLVAMNQLTIVIGILLSYCVNYALAPSGANNWRWMFGCAAVPSILFLLALLRVPESPRWLVEKGRTEEALGVLAAVQGPEEARLELESIAATVAGETGSLREPRLRRPLAIAIALAVFQQITGINTIIYYGSLLFVERIPGQSDSSALLANVIIGATNLVCTIAAMGMVDRAGRRPLLLFATGGMGVALCMLAAAIHAGASGAFVLGFVLLYVSCFAVGLGPGAWIVMAEIFPTRVRGRAMSLATVSLWLACLLITATFLTLMNALSVAGAFLVYAAMCAGAFLLVLRWVPETKGRTLEEIERSWTQPS